MQHHRVIARDEWFPARRRRPSRENELTRRHDQLCPERRRNENGADFNLIKLEESRRRVSAIG
jgi:predicted dithiol-disulfide oxidoreductase (DUF899 family)